MLSVIRTPQCVVDSSRVNHKFDPSCIFDLGAIEALATAIEVMSFPAAFPLTLKLSHSWGCVAGVVVKV